jgi:hypothetical protein
MSGRSCASQFVKPRPRLLNIASWVTIAALHVRALGDDGQHCERGRQNSEAHDKDKIGTTTDPESSTGRKPTLLNNL